MVGASLGMAGGFQLGAAAATLLPGVGPVLAFGLAGAALLGAGGTVAGAVAGGLADQKSTAGLPEDEIFFYEDALRQGRSVVIVLANQQAEVESARRLLAAAGAETVDAAREPWWIGLRDVEEEHYRALGGDYKPDEKAYRAGFEAALRRECRDKTAEAVEQCLRSSHPEIWNSPAFRSGYERGRAYVNSWLSGRA